MGDCGLAQFVAYFFLGSLVFFILTLPTMVLLFFGIACHSTEQRLLNPNTCAFIPSNKVSYILLGAGAAICVPNLVCVCFSLRCFCADPDHKDGKNKVGPGPDDEEDDEQDQKDVTPIFYAEDIMRMKAENQDPQANGNNLENMQRNTTSQGENRPPTGSASASPHHVTDRDADHVTHTDAAQS